MAPSMTSIWLRSKILRAFLTSSRSSATELMGKSTKEGTPKQVKKFQDFNLSANCGLSSQANWRPLK